MLEGFFETAAYMQNRELSWLKFNERVLLEASRSDMPLLERLKFISIFSSNLDEFFMIRVGSLTDSALLGDKIKDNKTGMTAKGQLSEIYRAIPPLYALAGSLYTTVVAELAKNGVVLKKMHDLSDAEIKTMRNHFTHNVMPILSPSIVDAKHPFPHIPNKQLHIIISLAKKKGKTFSLIAIPSNTDRLVFLDATSFVLLEDLVEHFIDLLFPNHTILEKCVISVTRNADFDTAEELLDEDIDFRQHMKALIKKRQRMAPVRLEFSCPISSEVLDFLFGKLSLKRAQAFFSIMPLDLSFGFSLSRFFDKDKISRLVWHTHVPADPLPSAVTADMLEHSAKKDILLSYPFESMSPFLHLIRQASEDPSVLSIKITLYRIDAQSRLAGYLIRAAENGKEIIVLMELRARFDENNNIEWANRLEEAGCRVIYGLLGYKCHSKLCLITRKDSGKINFITQIGTGNYNENTAKLYTDLSLITANPEIGSDAVAFFNNMLIDNLEGEYAHLWVAPSSFKSNVLMSIENERKKALSGGRGKIVFKCNSLTDKDIIEKLVEAADCGVEVKMNIRGICCLVPGLAGVTDNIQVISIVGRFLEHTRIYCFGESDDELIYISSADLMTRNTQRRVEVACPILDPDLRKTVRWMLDVMFSDDTNAWDLQCDGSYVLRTPRDPDNPMSSQELFIRNAKVLARYADDNKGLGGKGNGKAGSSSASAGGRDGLGGRGGSDGRGGGLRGFFGRLFGGS